MKQNDNGASFVKYIFYIFIIAALAVTAACGSNSGDGDSPTKASKADAPQLTEPTKHGGGYGWERDKCFLCHPVPELKEIHEYSKTLGESFSKIGDDDTGVCLYCHGTNGLQNVTAETYQCMLCHTDERIVRSANMFGGQNMHDLNNDGEIDNYDCVVCHEFSDMNGEIDLDIDFRKASTAYENKTAFCLNCHDGNGAFSVMPPALSFNSDSSNIYSTYKGTGTTTAEQMQTADIHGVKNGSGQSFATFRGAYANNQEISCLSCHQAHTSDNAYLITESGASAKLADDEAKNASVSVEGSNFTELCAVCHMSENGAITNNGLKEVVHTSTYSSNCTDCHYHGAGHGTDQDGLF